MREERDAARDEREATSAAARAEIQYAAAEQERLIEEVFESRLQLALGTRQSQSAVRNSPAAGGRSTTNISGATLRPALRVGDPVRNPAGNKRTGTPLTLPALHIPRVQGEAEEAARVEFCWFK